MTEEQPEKHLGSGSEDHTAEDSAEKQTGPESEGLPTGDSMEEPTPSESEQATMEGAGDQQLATESAEASTGEPESLPEAVADGTKEESRAGRFVKRALRWVVMLLVVFTLGVVAMQLVRVGPLNEERDSLNQSLAEAQAANQDLQAEIDRLEDVDEENQALSDALQQVEAKLALLNVLVDVTRAQLALAQQDPLRVAAALQGTGEKLSALRDLISPAAASDLDGIRERLILALSEVDGDPFAAERDLEILANTLLEIERELSGE